MDGMTEVEEKALTLTNVRDRLDALERQANKLPHCGSDAFLASEAGLDKLILQAYDDVKAMMGDE